MPPDGGADSAAQPAFDPETYASWFETDLGRLVWRDERAVLLPLLGSVQGRTVLDAGIGEARLGIELARLGAQVTGVDASMQMLGLARRRAVHLDLPLSLVGGRVEALPFPSGSYDLVTAVTVLCFVEDPAAAVRELSRVLRPGGRLVIGELGQWSLWAARRRLGGLLENTPWKQARFWTPGSLERVTRESGLEAVGRGSAVFYPPSATMGRLLRPLERRLAGCQTALGAAFIAVAAERS